MDNPPTSAVVLADSTPFKKALLENCSKKVAVWRVSAMTGSACVCTLQCHSHSCSPLSLSLSLLVVEDAGSALSLARSDGGAPPSLLLSRSHIRGERCSERPALPYSSSFPIVPHRRRLTNVSREVKTRNGAIPFDGPFQFHPISGGRRQRN